MAATYGLTKDQKLCSETAISMLFGSREGVKSALAFPLRAVWRVSEGRRDQSRMTRFLISIPKKRLRHAVDRVKMRRRVREAYRLTFPSHPALADARVDLAFIYVADKLKSYGSVERAVQRLLNTIDPSTLTVAPDEQSK